MVLLLMITVIAATTAVWADGSSSSSRPHPRYWCRRHRWQHHPAPHDHRELPHCAVQYEAGIMDRQHAVMPHCHCDAQFLEQRPGARGIAGPRPAATAPTATAFAAAATVSNGSSCAARVPLRRWDADRIQFPPIYQWMPPLPHPPLVIEHVSCPTSDCHQMSVFCRSTISKIKFRSRTERVWRITYVVMYAFRSNTPVLPSSIGIPA